MTDMTPNIHPEDRRYLSYEQRAAEDSRYRGKVESKPKYHPVCYCGKTVLSPGITCPRKCQ